MAKQQLHTPRTVASRLGISVRRVQQIIKELGIVPDQMVSQASILSAASVKRIENRKTKRGRAKKN